MSERMRINSATDFQNRYQANVAKMSDGDIGPRKSMIILVIVVGCFAVLWPKVFYPMLMGSANQHMKPNDLDKGCCDVISETDINTIKIMSELCSTIIQQTDEKPLSGKEIVTQCRSAVLNTCGIDISAVLQEQVRLGHTFKQILDEVRSLNGSLCLKYNFGVSPWRLGVPHRVSLNLAATNVRQERPAHLRPEMLHPALREKGRAIAQPTQIPTRRGDVKIVEGRPGPVPGVRPPLGGAGHVSQSQKGTSSMSIIMPIYTVAIVIFFTYTLMKVLFKKKPEVNGLYHAIPSDPTFRKEVFEAAGPWACRSSRNDSSSKLVVNAMSALLDEVDQEMEARRKSCEVDNQKEPTSNGNVMPTNASTAEQEQTSVKVMGMEMTASCEGGQRWSRPNSPVIPSASPAPIELPHAIYLEGALPPQSQLLVYESKTETQPNTEGIAADDPAVVLASKMTLSVIGLEASSQAGLGDGSKESTKLEIINGNHVDDYVGKKDVESDIFLDEDIIDDSKYVTASGATAAEHDISDEEQTDNEVEIEEEVEIVNFDSDEVEEVADVENGYEEERDYAGKNDEILSDENVGEDETDELEIEEIEYADDFEGDEEEQEPLVDGQTLQVDGLTTIDQREIIKTEASKLAETKPETAVKIDKMVNKILDNLQDCKLESRLETGDHISKTVENMLDNVKDITAQETCESKNNLNKIVDEILENVTDRNIDAVVDEHIKIISNVTTNIDQELDDLKSAVSMKRDLSTDSVDTDLGKCVKACEQMDKTGTNYWNPRSTRSNYNT